MVVRVVFGRGHWCCWLPLPLPGSLQEGASGGGCRTGLSRSIEVDHRCVVASLRWIVKSQEGVDGKRTKTNKKEGKGTRRFRHLLSRTLLHHPIHGQQQRFSTAVPILGWLLPPVLLTPCLFKNGKAFNEGVGA